jgi:5-formyltetrahydrofolate cyclo-ligase
MNKQQIREKLLDRRHALSQAAIEKSSETICKKVLAELAAKRFSKIHVYSSIDEIHEVKTDLLIKTLRQTYPDIHIEIGTTTIDSKFPVDKFDIIVVPVLGYDDNNHRIGMGGGWYDRWLADQPSAFKIGLAYRWAKLKAIPFEPHDKTLNRIISD